MENVQDLPREVRVLQDITLSVSASLDEARALDVLLERVVRDLGYRAATIRFWNEELQALELRAAFGLSDAYLKKGAVDVAGSEVDRRVVQGETVAISDVSRDPGFQYPEAAKREGLVTMLAVPLQIRRRAIGVLHVYTDSPRVFTVRERAFLETLANLAAQAIDRAHWFAAFQRIAHEFNSSLALADVLKALLGESVRELNVKAGLVRLLGQKRETLHLVASVGLSEAYLNKGAVKVATSPIDQQVMQDGKPVLVPDVEDATGLQYPEAAEQEGIRSMLVLPLAVKGVLIGVMRLYSGQVRRFSREELDFAMAVADLGAVAIENAKLHQALEQRLNALKEDADGWYRFLAFS